MAENMREKYESLKVGVLKDLARSRKIPKPYLMKKAELVEAMLRQDELDKRAGAAQDKKAEGPKKSEDKPKRRPGRPRRSERKPEAKLEEDLEADKLSREETGRSKETLHKARMRAEKSRQQAEDRRESRTSRPETSEAREPKEGKQETRPETWEERKQEEISRYHDLKVMSGILEVMKEGYGFIRAENYMPGENDIYVSASQIRRFSLRTGDEITGKTRKNNPNDKYAALLYIESVNGMDPDQATKHLKFEKMTPIFPNERIVLEQAGSSAAMRIVDLFSPIGKGQRGMIVSQPKAGKTTLLKEIASSVKASHPEMKIIVLLIDERPEEVTDMKESIEGGNVEVIYSTFDEEPEHHKKVSEMVIERARRLVECGKDVMILLDSITRLSRAYNLTVAPSGKTLSGGLDPTALYMPKRFFGAARNMREGGSLTILATALVNTGSKMDDVVFEEFKGTGNMELVLDRKLSEQRVFPAIDLAASGTRREDLLLSRDEQECMAIVRRGLSGMRKDDATESILNAITHTRSNADFIRLLLRRRVL